jgi:acyl-CoA synthetase (AMP-forming)/AMP-acid ligase II
MSARAGPPAPQPLLIGDVFRRNAALLPNQVAASLEDASLTHGELDRLGNRMAWTLRDLGIGHGDRIVAWADTCLEVLPLFVAAAKLGATFAPVNARLGPDEAPSSCHSRDPRCSRSIRSARATPHAWPKPPV